jgi:hypothetical protein
VRSIVIASRLAAGHDRAIRMLFAAASAGIPMLQTEMN